jgi:hypothetical protein
VDVGSDATVVGVERLQAGGRDTFDSIRLERGELFQPPAQRTSFIDRERTVIRLSRGVRRSGIGSLSGRVGGALEPYIRLFGRGCRQPIDNVFMLASARHRACARGRAHQSLPAVYWTRSSVDRPAMHGLG